MISKEQIRNRHNLKASEDDYFAKFVFEYLAFIAYLRKYKFYDSSDDRDAIQLLKQSQEIKEQYFSYMSEEVINSWNIIITEFKAVARLWNASRLKDVEELTWRNHNCEKQRFCTQNGCWEFIIHADIVVQYNDMPKWVIWSTNDWTNMVEFWRAIRDNLFHWAKDPENSRDKLVVEYWYKTLKPLVEIFLST